MSETRGSELAARRCVPCAGGAQPLKGEALAALSREVPQWRVVGEHHLERSFAFPDFKAALAFVDRVGALAEEQNHHPDLTLSWGKVGVTIFTHKIGGLTESDFVLAAKIERL